MIRAVVRNGTIQPLDPLPSSWEEGQEVQITELDPIDDPEAIERWCRELESIGNQPDDPADWERMEAVLAEADREAKDLMRKEMGLD
jgi:hypothetical protein